MYLKRGFLILIVLLTLFTFYKNTSTEDLTFRVVDQNNICQEINENNIEENALKIWNTFSKIDEYKDKPDKILEVSLSAIDSLQQGDNGYEFKEELKEKVKSVEKTSVECINNFILCPNTEKNFKINCGFKDIFSYRDYLIKGSEHPYKDCWEQESLCIDNKCTPFEDLGWNDEILENVRFLVNGYKEQRDNAVDKLGDIGKNNLHYYFFKEEDEINQVVIPLIRALEYETNELSNKVLQNPIEINGESFTEMHPAILALQKSSSENIFYQIVLELGRKSSLVEENRYKFLKRMWLVLELRGETNEAINMLMEQFKKADKENKLHIIYILQYMPSKKLKEEILPEIYNLFEDTTDRDIKQSLGEILIEHVNHPFLKNKIEKIITGISSIYPEDFYSLMKNDSLFEEIYNNKLISTLSESSRTKGSIALAVYRDVSKKIKEGEIKDIDSSIEKILKKREEFSDKIILGKEVYTIIFSHIDGTLGDGPIFEFAKSRGVNKFYFNTAKIDSNVGSNLMDIEGFYEKLSKKIDKDVNYEGILDNILIDYYSSSFEIEGPETEYYEMELKNEIEREEHKKITISKLIEILKLYQGLQSHYGQHINNIGDIDLYITNFIKTFEDTNIIFFSKLIGMDNKDEITKSIIESKKFGKTTIWINAHGLPDFVCLGGGIPLQNSDLSHISCQGYNYQEFADILLKRGNLEEVNLIVASCFSYDFVEQLINTLKIKKSTTFPTVISIANKGKKAHYSKFKQSHFLQYLNKLEIKEKSDLKGEHILIVESEIYSDDPVIFFSEDKTSPPLEISMGSLNPTQCGECIGDQCPIES